MKVLIKPKRINNKETMIEKEVKLKIKPNFLVVLSPPCAPNIPIRAERDPNKPKQ